MEIGPKPSEAGVTTPRALGRIVLAGMLTVLVGLIALPLGLAQTATTIEFVNPAGTTSTIVSDKAFPYGITAWIDAVPANPRVEFRLKTGSGPVTNGGPFVATQTAGSTDTFQFDWTIDDAIADGAYTLEATLYKDYTGPGTGTVVDTVDQAVTVDQAAGAPPLGAAAAENVRISYPVNGGPLGVSIPASGGSSFLIEGDTGATSNSIAGFYSVSPVGTAATFKTCGAAVVPADTDTDGDDDFKIRCALAAEDFGLSVTGVAAKAASPGVLPVQPVAGASDGHRVKPYFQRPTTLTIDPETIGSATTSTCQTFAVTVKDQNARPITGANVDVHAQGPNDGLKFDVDADSASAFGSSPSQAPDKGEHGAEAGVVCAANGSSAAAGPAGSQGSHPVAGQSSRKHIESIASGTNSDGQFKFALYSTASGATQITAWGDLDDDDLLCNAEAKDAASIGWGAAAPVPAAEASTVPTCVVSDPTPTPSSSTSATSSATASATTSATASPTTSATASPTASPSPSPTGEPRINERNISLTIKDAKHKMLKANGRVTLKDADDFAGCTQDVPVTLQKRKKGKWVTVGTDSTNDDGKYVIKAPHKHGRYRALAPEVEMDGGQEICSRAKKTFRVKD